MRADPLGDFDILQLKQKAWLTSVININRGSAKCHTNVADTFRIPSLTIFPLIFLLFRFFLTDGNLASEK